MRKTEELIEDLSRLKARISNLEDEISAATRDCYASSDDSPAEVHERVVELENKIGGAILRFMRGES